jgi:hypothetical protein
MQRDLVEERRWLANPSSSRPSRPARRCPARSPRNRQIRAVDAHRRTLAAAGVRALPPDALIIADGFSCRSQIRHAINRRPLHLAEAFAQPALINAPSSCADTRAGRR